MSDNFISVDTHYPNFADENSSCFWHSRSQIIFISAELRLKCEFPSCKHIALLRYVKLNLVDIANACVYRWNLVLIVFVQQR